MRTAQLSKTAANKRVRELEILLSDTTSAMHDALQFAIEDMLLDAGTQEVKADEYIGALRLLKRAHKHQERLTKGFDKSSKLEYWGHGVYSPFDNLYSRVVHREKLDEI